MRRDCPFCHHERATVRIENQPTKTKGGARNIMKCDECGLFYPRPRFDEPESAEYWAHVKDYEVREKFLDPLRAVSNRDYLVSVLKKYAKTRGNALDIGTSEGRYCHVFESLGYKAYGIEPLDSVASFAREHGLRVCTGSFPDDIPADIADMKYNLISVLETMYYFIDLRKSIEKLYNMLNPGGMLLVKSVQGLSRYYKTSTYFSRYNDSVQGIPTLGSLGYCLRKAGFEIVIVKGLVSFDLLPLNLDFIRNDLARRIILRIYNKAFLDLTLLDIKQADRLIVLARKPIPAI